MAASQADVLEPCITRAMLAAGMEAFREAHVLCLPEADLVMEIYRAMYGEAVKALCEAPEFLQ